MAVQNIDRFNELTAEIFAKLYQSFPVPLPLITADFGIKIDDNNWDDPAALQEAKFVISTFQWLANAGFINYDSVNYPHYMTDAVLTEKGLEVLNAIPDSVNLEKTLGDRLVDGVKEGATESVKETVKQALSAGVAIGWKFLTTAHS